VDKTLSLVAKSFLSFLLIINANDIFAQGSGGSSILVYTLVIIGVILLLGAIMQVSDNLLQIEAQQYNVKKPGMGLYPKLTGMFSRSLPPYLADKEVHMLKRGYDIQLEGSPAQEVTESARVTRYAIQPPNWRGIAPIPKMLVATGETVEAGQPLFFDKSNPEIRYVAPVSGEVIEINRGDKRAIVEIVILADKDIRYKEFKAPELEAPREEIVAFLLESGGWTLINQRPFDVVAEPSDVPANIFISTFDTAPLAPDLNLAVAGHEREFQKGLEVLAKLTNGAVHLGLDARKDKRPAAAFENATGVQKHYFSGAHPAGNVGIQIHHIAPIHSRDIVWTLGVQEVMTLGGLFLNGRYDASRVVALAGEPLKSPRHVRTFIGANLGELLADEVTGGHNRIISGDVLSGEAKSDSSYLNFRDDQVTVIEEGDHFEMFGWLVPSKPRPSVSRTYLTSFIPGLQFKGDTNTHGEKRAFVMTGQYESVLPMNILPQHLMKAILANDFERMEGLGIYELSEEDIALCEFACTSKMPLQSILREGLDAMREQG